MTSLMIVLWCATTLAADAAPAAPGGNRLTYLDELNPYYVGRHFPKLVTPQWVGEEGIEAVVVLGIDDMRGHEKWENYLRPILERLKKIDGRAPVSIMTCQIDPRHPHLQQWLREGLSLECHTVDHPCPLLSKGDFAAAKSTYDRCIDLLAAVPGNRPVAFRTPCCDSLNTVSPRFFAEIFNSTTPQGRYLEIDTSVFNLITPSDSDLPREVVVEPDGSDRFRKYLPADRRFVNTIFDYPYPYVIGRLAWEFPCVAPSDWSAQHLHKPNNPDTVRDWKLALDAHVIRQGSFNLVFHPHGWIRAEQVIELIDHALQQHGRRVKFLTFREALERLNKNLLLGQPLRAANGQDNGVRLLDLNNDGYLDVVIGNEMLKRTRIWSPEDRRWIDSDFPLSLVTVAEDGTRRDAGARFGIAGPGGQVVLLWRNVSTGNAWRHTPQGWVSEGSLLSGLEVGGAAVLTTRQGLDGGVRLRDLDGDGSCELIVAHPSQRAVFSWSGSQDRWVRLPFALPEGATLVDGAGRDRGLRFVDFDEDGHDDVVLSNESGYRLDLFEDMKQGWSRRVLAGPRSGGQIPMITRLGTHNGAFFHSNHIWVQNEDTDRLPDLVERRSYIELLQSVEPRSKSPLASLRSWRVREGFEIELVAAEPLVMDPIAFDWGPDGKLWVVEMADYPLGLDDKGQPGGRVRYLEDTDGDGRYDRSTLFLDDIPFPTGVLPWRRGVMISAAPDVFYAEDTDTDGRADHRETLYTGFHPGNQQHRVNGLRFGLDNWVYLANGDSGGEVKSVKTGESVSLGGRDLRIRPEQGALDLASGKTQFGRNPDDWGNWFGNNNPNPGWHYVLEDHYLRRNPYLAGVPPSVDLTPHRSVYAVGRALSHWEGYKPPKPGEAGLFTSCCSITPYRDNLFGPGFEHAVFISEPVHSAIHRLQLTPRGATFAGRRPADEQNREFLASTDSWTRPTTLRTGPDGALWIADMYRLVIEHPEWIDDRTEKALNLRAGHEQGRIYRVYPTGSRPRPIPRLDQLDTAGLVKALESPSGWQRDMVQQMLIWQRGDGAVPLLEKLAATSQQPLARLHALCTLDGLQKLRAEVLLPALGDAHSGVRRHAVRLAERRLQESPELGAALLALSADSDPQVRLQLACSLGEWDDARAGKLLGQMAVEAVGDPHLYAAVMSSVTKRLDDVLQAVVERPSPPPMLVDQLIGLAFAYNHQQAIARSLEVIGRSPSDGQPGGSFARVLAVLEALGRRGKSLSDFGKGASESLKPALARLEEVLAEAGRAAESADAPLDTRLLAVRLLGRDPARLAADLAALQRLLAPQVPGELQTAAALALARSGDRRAPELLLAGWKGHGPKLRGVILDAMLERWETTRALVAAVERRQVLPAEFDAPRRQRLLQHPSEEIRTAAHRIFGSPTDAARSAILAQYRQALQSPGDETRGAAVFQRACAKCHKLGDTGYEVGPDLRAITDRSREAMLVAVLDPNRAVEAKYQNYSAVLTDGRILTGMLVSETGGSIILAPGEGKQHVIPRADLEALESSGKSLMPEGMEKDLAPADLSDLLAYLEAHGPPRRVFAGNQPELIKAGTGGVLQLRASNCEIYGSEIQYEPRYGNLGFWSSPQDRAVWQIELAGEQTYHVVLDFACADNVQGNELLLECGPHRLVSKVPGTGNWDTYQEHELGRLKLAAGKHRVVVRSSGRIKGYLIDLRGVYLVPVEGK